MHPTISKRKPYSPYFNPNQFSPALWLDGADASTLLSDGAASFTAASGQRLTCASNSTLETGNVDWAWAFWIYRGIATSGLIEKMPNNPSSSFRDYDIFVDAGTITAVIYDNSGGTVASVNSGSITSNAWEFVIVVHDSVNDKLSISKNGASFTHSGSYSGTPASGTNSLSIGAFSNGTSYFSGRLDSVCFFKPTSGWLASNATALRDYLYNSGNGRRSSDFINSSLYSGSGAVSWWDLDEQSGTRKDRIGTNDLTDNNSVGYASGIASGNVQYDGDPIKQWSDKSGNARHVTAPSDAARPTFKTEVQNGKSVTLFDSTDDGLVSAFDFDIATSKTITLFFVGKRISGTTAKYFNLQRTGLPDYTSGISVYQSSTNIFVYVIGRGDGGSTAERYRTNVHNADFSSFGISSATVSTSGISVWSNGAAKSLTTSGSLTVPNWLSQGSGNHRVTLGGRATSASNTLDSFSNIQLAEVILYTSILSDSQRQQVERYLASKWGIALS